MQSQFGLRGHTHDFDLQGDDLCDNFVDLGSWLII